jgi:hypothetical protein
LFEQAGIFQQRFESPNFFGKDCHVTTCRRRGSKDLRLLLMRIGYSF